MPVRADARQRTSPAAFRAPNYLPGQLFRSKQRRLPFFFAMLRGPASLAAPHDLSGCIPAGPARNPDPPGSRRRTSPPGHPCHEFAGTKRRWTSSPRSSAHPYGSVRNGPYRPHGTLPGVIEERLMGGGETFWKSPFPQGKIPPAHLHELSHPAYFYERYGFKSFIDSG